MEKSDNQNIKRDVFNFKIVEAYNEQKFKGIIDVNSNIGDELSIKNPDYDKDKNPNVPARLFYYPIKVGIINYLLPSEDIGKLPIKVFDTTKITVGSKAYHRIDNAVSVRIKSEKKMEYKDFINGYLTYKHRAEKQWLVWKIIAERAISETFYIRAISYPSWGKTSSYYVAGMLRNDIEILDNTTYAKMKYSLSVKPRALVLDEVDDINPETKRSLAKIFRNAGGGMGKLGNDSRAVGGTVEVFDLGTTSIVALYNFPSDANDKFFDTNFHPKVLSRLFPILLNGGSNTQSPMLHIHKKYSKYVTEKEKEILDNFLRTSKHYEQNWETELISKGKDKWVAKHEYQDTRWQQTYASMCNGLKLYADTIEEFHILENTLYQMNQDYLEYKKRYEMGKYDWVSKEKQVELEDIEDELL